MINAMLDGYPSDFEGYLIRTDFRIGIQISQCLRDDEYEEHERVAIALKLLYGCGIPDDIEQAMRGLGWFLAAGDPKEPDLKMKPIEEADSDDEEDDAIFDFDVDSGRIISAFRRFYNIDLTHAKMHWFEFLGLMGDLGECAFSKIVGYRNMNLSDIPQTQRQTYAELKKKYSLRKQEYTEEEQERINAFLAELQGNTT